jgi:hypothetical protein
MYFLIVKEKGEISKMPQKLEPFLKHVKEISKVS